MENSKPVEVVHNMDARRFEIELDGQLARLDYRRADGKLFLVHTEVPAAREGRGYGSKLTRAALEYAEGEGLPVVPSCPFVHSYIQRHPEYQKLVESE